MPLAPEERQMLADAVQVGFGERPELVALLCAMAEELGFRTMLSIVEAAEQELIDTALEEWALRSRPHSP